jgi:tetratricopeptide (TPR) repeat protein
MLLLGTAAAAANPWGSLKKIYFYEASGNLDEVRSNLQRLDAQAIPPAEKSSLLRSLAELGDRYYAKKNYSLAEAFYRKALQISPADAWPVYNQLERIGRRGGRLFWNFAYVGRQFGLVALSFSGAYILADSVFSVLLFAGLLLFFLVALALGVRHFKLAAHDFILEAHSHFSVPRLLLLLLLLLWPLAVTGGWGFYPFLLCGLLWSYCSHDERLTIRRILVLLLVLAFFYSLGQYLEKSLRSPGFQRLRQVYSGQLFPEKTWSRFDNEIKVMQAYAYYHQGQYDEALDILHATGSGYASPLKYNLLGNIDFERGNLPQSIQYYRGALSIDDSDPVTLKNFTVALLRNNDPELFVFYSKSYPRINDYKDKVVGLQKDRLPERILWRRLLNFSWQSFHFPHFLKVVALEFLRLPVLLAVLLAWAYIAVLKKLFFALGQSMFCSKCSKIIRKAPIEQAPSHALCEECYQLFLIKDPIFLEAKILKEKEIGRQFRLKNSLILAATLLVPGFLLNFREKGQLFALLFLPYFAALGLCLFGGQNFKGSFGAVPMFLNLAGIAAVLLYVAINVYSLRRFTDGI